MASVEFNYEGKSIIIQCNNYDTLDKIIQQYITKSQVAPNSVSFLYNGDLITNKYLTFDQLSNSYDKSRNKMNVLVTNSISKSSLEFKFEVAEGADESMKDFAKMAILLAIQEYPDDYPKQCNLISKKFFSQYGGIWSCIKYKAGLGGYNIFYYDYLMRILYGDYKFIILKSMNEEFTEI